MLTIEEIIEIGQSVGNYYVYDRPHLFHMREDVIQEAVYIALVKAKKCDEAGLLKYGVKLGLHDWQRSQKEIFGRHSRDFKFLRSDAVFEESREDPGYWFIEELSAYIPVKSKLDTPLSPRQLEILTLSSEGYLVPKIASLLFLSPHTIKSHNKVILKKLGAHNITHAVALAYQQGVLTVKEE